MNLGLYILKKELKKPIGRYYVGNKSIKYLRGGF